MLTYNLYRNEFICYGGREFVPNNIKEKKEKKGEKKYINKKEKNIKIYVKVQNPES